MDKARRGIPDGGIGMYKDKREQYVQRYAHVTTHWSFLLCVAAQREQGQDETRQVSGTGN